MSPSAIALVDCLAASVGALETRGNRRGASGKARLNRAVGAIVAGLLGHWGRPEPRAAFRPVERGNFTGTLVGSRQFEAAMGGLVGLGMVDQHGSLSVPID